MEEDAVARAVKPAAARVRLKPAGSRPLSTGIVINRYVPQA
jgi:hypothetical protein